MSGPLQPQETRIVVAPARLPTPAKLALTGVGGALAVAALAGAAVAVFQLSVTLVTIAAILVAVLATAAMLPALQMALAAGRLRAMVRNRRWR